MYYCRISRGPPKRNQTIHGNQGNKHAWFVQIKENAETGSTSYTTNYAHLLPKANFATDLSGRRQMSKSQRENRRKLQAIKNVVTARALQIKFQISENRLAYAHTAKL